MKKIIHWMIAATVVGALAGCARTAPIEQVNAIVSAGHTEAQVKDAIIKAGAQRQWIMSDAGPGVIKVNCKIATMSRILKLTTPQQVILLSM